MPDPLPVRRCLIHYPLIHPLVIWPFGQANPGKNMCLHPRRIQPAPLQWRLRVKPGKSKFQAMPTASHETAAPNVRQSRPVRPGWLPVLFVSPGFACRAEPRVKAGKTEFPLTNPGQGWANQNINPQINPIGRRPPTHSLVAKLRFGCAAAGQGGTGWPHRMGCLWG